MIENNDVVWTWSFIDPVNVLFIYRWGGREIRIDIRNYKPGSSRYITTWLLVKERELLFKLSEDV